MPDALSPSAEEALAAWSNRVARNNEQSERMREAPAGTDFYAPVAAAFKADPHRTDEPALDVLRSMVQPGETWLDIGAGGGRYALPIALLAREVIAVDPSDGMLAVLRESQDEAHITNVRTVQSRWPSEHSIEADVSLISHVGYDIADIGPFLDAMERASRRMCVAILLAKPPAAMAEPFWPPVNGEPRAQLPALPEFLALQLARGRLCEVRLLERSGLWHPKRDSLIAGLRQQLFVQPGSDRDARLLKLAGEVIVERDGRFAVDAAPVPLGIVTWKPR